MRELEVRDDLYTLTRADEITGDKGRMKRVQALARKDAKKASDLVRKMTGRKDTGRR